MVVPPSKIAGIVLTDLDDECEGLGDRNAVTDKIGWNVSNFLVNEMRAGRLPKEFLPLQSGVGDIANSVLAALGEDQDIPPLLCRTP